MEFFSMGLVGLSFSHYLYYYPFRPLTVIFCIEYLLPCSKIQVALGYRDYQDVYKRQALSERVSGGGVAPYHAWHQAGV